MCGVLHSISVAINSVAMWHNSWASGAERLRGRIGSGKIMWRRGRARIVNRMSRCPIYISQTHAYASGWSHITISAQGAGHPVQSGVVIIV